MSTLIRLAILSLLLGLSAPARAAEVEVAEGPICYTSKQVERLAALFPTDAQSAVRQVNAEEHDPTACDVANVAYVRGARIATVRTEHATFEIAEILVIGTVTEEGVETTKPALYFSLFVIDERVA